MHRAKTWRKFAIVRRSIKFATNKLANLITGIYLQTIDYIDFIDIIKLIYSLCKT